MAAKVLYFISERVHYSPRVTSNACDVVGRLGFVFLRTEQLRGWLPSNPRARNQARSLAGPEAADGAMGTHETSCLPPQQLYRADAGVRRGRSAQAPGGRHLAFRPLWVGALSIPCQAAHTMSPRTNCFSSGGDSGQ